MTDYCHAQQNIEKESLRQECQIDNHVTFKVKHDTHKHNGKCSITTSTRNCGTQMKKPVHKVRNLSTST